MYLHKTKNGHYTPPCCYFSGELEVVEILRSGLCSKASNCLHFDFKNLEYFINKHNWYSSRETVDYFENLENAKAKSELDAKSWFKMNVYYKLPIGFRSHLYYLYRYYIKLGFCVMLILNEGNLMCGIRKIRRNY